MNKKDAIDDAAERAINAADIEKMIGAAVSKALSALDPKKLAEKVENKVEGAWIKMVYSMLGFESSWGSEFRVDHCNDRQSSVSEMLKNKAHQAVDEFLKRGAAELDKLPIDEKVLKAIKNEYNECFNRRLSDRVKQKAEADVEAFVNNKLAKTLDQYVEPEAEAINALHQAIKNVKDPNVAELLKKSLAELETYTLKALD